MQKVARCPAKSGHVWCFIEEAREKSITLRKFNLISDQKSLKCNLKSIPHRRKNAKILPNCSRGRCKSVSFFTNSHNITSCVWNYIFIGDEKVEISKLKSGLHESRIEEMMLPFRVATTFIGPFITGSKNCGVLVPLKLYNVHGVSIEVQSKTWWQLLLRESGASSIAENQGFRTNFFKHSTTKSRNLTWSRVIFDKDFAVIFLLKNLQFSRNFWALGKCAKIEEVQHT